MKAFFSNLFYSKYARPLLFLALALLALVLLGSLPGLLDSESPAWIAPSVPTSTPPASPTPGWWNHLPTPLPLEGAGKPDNGEQP